MSELANYIVAGIIHKELVVSTSGTFPPSGSDLQLILRADILPLPLNSTTTNQDTTILTIPLDSQHLN